MSCNYYFKILKIPKVYLFLFVHFITCISCVQCTGCTQYSSTTLRVCTGTHRFIMWIIFTDLWHFMKVLLNFIYENDFHSPHFFDLLKAVYLHLYVHAERTKVHVKRCYTRTVYHRAPHLRPFAIIESRSVVVMIRSTVDDIIDL